MNDHNNSCEGSYTTLTWVRFQNYRILIPPCKNRARDKDQGFGEVAIPLPRSSFFLFSPYLVCRRNFSLVHVYLIIDPSPLGLFRGNASRGGGARSQNLHLSIPCCRLHFSPSSYPFSFLNNDVTNVKWFTISLEVIFYLLFSEEYRTIQSAALVSWDIKLRPKPPTIIIQVQ